jgi:pimeloyl-ACP methyl ester carboxylesterase
VVGPAALLGISAGGPFAAACAARLDGRLHSLTLIAPLGAPGWPARGMAPGQRLALQAARRAPASGGWFLGRLAVLARRRPRLFLRLATSELPGIDRRALAQPGLREAFLAAYGEAFRQGSRGVAQDLRVNPRSSRGSGRRASRPGTRPLALADLHAAATANAPGPHHHRVA